MNAFPLSEFLQALSAEGIRISLNDYRRIATVLRSRERWTLGKLSQVLKALLVHDAEQEESFERCFRTFFAPDDSLPPLEGEIDLERALEELRGVGVEGDGPSTEQLLTPQLAPEQTVPGNTASGLSFWGYIVGFGLLFIIGFTLNKLLHTKQPTEERQSGLSLFMADSTRQLLMLPDSLILTAISLDTSETRTFKLVNQDTVPVAIDVFVPGNITNSIILKEKRFSIAPKDTINFDITFKPLMAKHYRDTLIFIPQQIVPPPPDTTVRPQTTTAGGIYLKRITYGLTAADIFLTTPYPLMLLIGLLILLIAKLSRRYLPQKPPGKVSRITPDKSPRFTPSVIGGEAGSWFREAELDELAEALGYFASEISSSELHVPASIRRTLQRSGIPDLVFRRRKMIRKLLVLEDRQAEGLQWNPVPRELAAGLALRGVPVIYGRCQGSPESFVNEAGETLFLSDLEDHKNGLVLLFFTDGGALTERGQARALELLAGWPAAAWMTLQEGRFRDPRLLPARRAPLPVYPATPAGCRAALKSFLSEYGISGQRAPQHAPAGWVGGNREVAVEALLGEALPWAEDCAAVPWPCSIALAERLRRRFHPHLPRELIGRFFQLPGISYSRGGFTFTPKLQNTLRRRFLARRNRAAQQEVLAFLLEAVEAAQPRHSPPESLAHLSWQALRERLYLEIDGDEAVKRLEVLAEGQLGDYIKDSLANYGSPEAPEKIPLLSPLREAATARRLKDMAPDFVPVSQRICFGSNQAAAGWLVILLICLGALLSFGYNILPAMLGRHLVLTFNLSEIGYDSYRPVAFAILQNDSLLLYGDTEYGIIYHDSTFITPSLNVVSVLNPYLNRWHYYLRFIKQFPRQSYQLRIMDKSDLMPISLVRSHLNYLDIVSNRTKPPDYWPFVFQRNSLYNKITHSTMIYYNRADSLLNIIEDTSGTAEILEIGSTKDRLLSELESNNNDLIDITFNTDNYLIQIILDSTHFYTAVPEMVFIPGGSFPMGSAEPGADSDEQPVHEVTVSDFEIGKYEVTFAEYDRFCEATGREKPDDRGWGREQRPVINVTWYDAVTYCNWRSQQENLTPVYTIDGTNVSCNFSANGYRLPTEAEWEYAARGGNISRGYTYSGGNQVDSVAWYYANSDGQSQPVGQKLANELGLHDMSGNVWEWCWDWYEGNYYASSDKIDPHGPAEGSSRVLRGGSWYYNPNYTRSADRDHSTPNYASSLVGFRLARTR